jgi:hypothetical protein
MAAGSGRTAPEAVKVGFELAAGSAAAVVAKSMVAPLDRVKARHVRTLRAHGGRC